MSDEEALFAAILAQPDEDTPRLVYADWLEEHGDEAGRARAEFIRLQIEFARGGLNDRKRKAVTNRCAELQNAHGDTWLVPFRTAGGNQLTDFVYQRGFVSNISGQNQLPVLFPDLAAVCPVQRVDIDFDWKEINERDAKSMPENFGQAVFASPHLTGLHTLYLQWGWVEQSVELVNRSPVSRNLRHLWVWGHSIGPVAPGSGLGTIVEAEWPALTQVRLDNLGLSHDWVATVVRAAVERRWHAVHISNIQITPASVTPVLEAVLASQLPSISLATNCDLSERPEPLPDNAKLLALWGVSRAGNESARWVIANVPPGRFNRLTLRSMRINVAVARDLAKWPGLAHLEELDLRGNQIGNSGAAALAESPHLEKVKLLLVWNNDITLKGKDVLKKRFGRRVRVAN